MVSMLRKLAVTAAAVAVSVGMLSAVAAPADAAVHVGSSRDSSWGY